MGLGHDGRAKGGKGGGGGALWRMGGAPGPRPGMAGVLDIQNRRRRQESALPACSVHLPSRTEHPGTTVAKGIYKILTGN